MHPTMADLLTETLAMARHSKLPMVRICREIGVTTRWFQNVVSGDTPDPSVRRIQRLHDYLVANDPEAARAAGVTPCTQQQQSGEAA